jgi:uncharacterized membrane protein
MSVSVLMAPRCVAAADPSWLGGMRPSASLRVPPVGVTVWRLDRNCSMAPRSLALVLGWLAVASLGISVFFVLQGAWLVLPFAIAEISALGLAFFVYARHATDGERVWFDGPRLVIERESRGRIEQRVFDATWLDAKRPEPGSRSISLVVNGETIDIGRSVSAVRRLQVWRELRQALAQRRHAVPSVDGST